MSFSFDSWLQTLAAAALWDVWSAEWTVECAWGREGVSIEFRAGRGP